MRPPLKSVSIADASPSETILAAALRVFSKFGVEGTAVPQIAKAAKVGVGSLYRYFDGKEDLVNELFRHTKQRLKARLENGLDLSAAPRALFADFWKRLTAFAIEEPEAFRFLELQDHLPYLDKKSRSVELEVLAPIWLMCVEMQKQGVMSRAMRVELAMAMVWGAFVGVFKAQHNGYLQIEKGELDAVRDACWQAITAKPGRRV